MRLTAFGIGVVLYLCGTGFGCLAAAGAVKPFSFSKVDLSLLEQVDLLDRKLERDGLVYLDARLDEYLARVGRAVTPAGPVPERVAWRFRAIRDPLPNAFALANGSIYVHTGLLGLLDNEAQLASVLAHEVTHVLERHSYVSYRSYRKKMALISAIQIGTSWAPMGEVWGASLQAVGAIVPVVLAATVQGYSRELERQADLYAVDKISGAGYDPRQMAETFRLLGHADDLEQIKVFYTDHPALEDRIAYVNGLIQSRVPDEAGPEKLAAQRRLYLATVQPAARHDVVLALNSGRLRTAFSSARKLADFDPASAENHYLLGEAWRLLGPRAPEVNAADLSSKAREEAQKRNRKFTREEQDRQLLETAAGRAAWEENQARAEQAYREALRLDPALAKAHRGLGMLFEAAGKRGEAFEAYRQYLTAAPVAPDRERIQRRLERLDPSLKFPEQRSGHE
jgi:predicted Zn-dependent protease